MYDEEIPDDPTLQAVLGALKQQEAKRSMRTGMGVEAPPDLSPAPPTSGTQQAQLPGWVVADLVSRFGMPQPTMLDSIKDLGSKAASAIAHPIDEGIPALKEMGKGALSGATFGLSENVNALKPDPETWAAGAGRLAGFAAPSGLIGAGLRGISGLRGLGMLGGRLASDALGGGITMGADEAIRPLRPGESADERHPLRAGIEGTALGAAVPLALRGVGAAARKLFSRAPRPPSTEPPAPGTTNVGDVPGVTPPGAGTPTGEEVAASIRAAMERENAQMQAARTPPTTTQRAAQGEAQQPDVIPLGGRPIPGSETTVPTPPVTAAAAAAAAPAEAVAPPGMTQQAWDTARAFAQKMNLPIRVFSKDPAAKAVMEKAFDATDRSGLLASETYNSMNNAIKQLSKEEQEQLKNLRLDFQGRDGIDQAIVAANPANATAMINANNELNRVSVANFQKLLDLQLVKPQDFIMNYTPMLRPKIIKRSGIDVQIGNEWVPVGMLRTPTQAKSFMTKERNVELPVSEKMRGMTLQEINALQSKAFAKVVATEENLIRGGENLGPSPTGQRPVPWLKTMVDQVQDPVLQDRLITYVSDFVGQPRGSIPVELSNAIRSTEFYHYIGSSLLAPMVNLTQNMIAWAHTSNSAFFKGAYSVFKRNTPMSEYVPGLTGEAANLSASEFAERFMGASGQHFKGDVQLVEPTFLGSRKLGYLADKTATPFRATESYNQKTTAMAGFFDALANGKGYEEAIKAGRDLNRYANKMGGPENTPELLRSTGASLIGQFKSFQIGMTGIMKDFATNAVKGLNQMAKSTNPEEYQAGLRQVMPAVKYMVGVGALVGPAGVMPFYDPEAKDNRDNIAGTFRVEVNKLMDQIPAPLRDGFLGLLGANITNQIGLGALPITNVRDMMWFLPGPAISHVMDAATAATYIGSRLAGSIAPHAGMDVSSGSSNFGGEASPDAAAGALTRAFPLGGPQLDRIRKFVHAQRAGGDEVTSYNLMQGLGLEPTLSGGTSLTRRQQPQPWLYEQLGSPRWLSDINSLAFNSPERQREIDRRIRLTHTADDYSKAAKDYATMVAQGDVLGAEQLRRQWESNHGVPMTNTPDAIKGAMDRRQQDSVERLMERMYAPQRYQELISMPPS